MLYLRRMITDQSFPLFRTVDMTYRLNLGILHYSAAKARELTDADAWTASMKKHFSPAQIRVRANIIRQV